MLCPKVKCYKKIIRKSSWEINVIIVETKNSVERIENKAEEISQKTEEKIREAIQESSIQPKRDQQIFSAKDRTVNSLGFAGQMVS